MANAFKLPFGKGHRQSKLIVRMLLPMLLAVLLQLAAFFAVLSAGGEFSSMERYAYNTLVDKTENRKNYIQNELQQKMPYVQETAGRLNGQIETLLRQQGAAIADIRTDKELNRRIMSDSVDTLVGLLRRSTANDVYLILDCGSLYAADGMGDARTALYLRDLDTTTDAGYEDLLMEIGFSSVSQEYGIILDSGWALHFDPALEGSEDYDFYYKTLETAKNNSALGQENLGLWSAMSKPSRSAAASLKYTVPMIAEDGTVYGVLGIGLTENTILSRIPANDFVDETACYVLGCGRTAGRFDVLTHSGASFQRFVGSAERIETGDMLSGDVCTFRLPSGADAVGSVRYMNLYNQESPYFSERWALISIADRSSVLSPLTSLIHMLVLAGLISLAVGVLAVVFSSREVVRPITRTIRTMNENQRYNQVLRFAPSGIYELDRMTEAITQLQINVQDFSSQVSQMIRIADVGLGTFLYDRTDDSVFVGQSLLKLLRFPMQQEEDVIMSRHVFLENIVAEETRRVVTESLDREPSETETKKEYVQEYSVRQDDDSTVWMRLSLVYSKNKSIGILQDITGVMMEKRRIEYERDYDSATGLLNRSAYYHYVERLFRDPKSLGVTAFLMIDLDNLKYVNDTYGHDFGDDYIKTAATTLKKFQNYGGIVSRLSGDEFNICLPGFASKDEAREVIREVREQLLQSYCLLADGKRFKIRASAGVAWYPDDAKSYEMLMKYADFAMYTVKHSTKGELAEFDMSAYAADSVLLTGVEEMNRIIDEGSVQYAFQSIVSAHTGEVYGYEALMRLQSSIFQSPLELIRTAKAGAKLYEIERLTWTKALDDFQTQIDEGRIAKDSRIFINSISNCVLEPADADAVEAAHPELLSRIVLEILESENVSEEYIARKLRRMKKWNAQVALDDFGTGYNSEYALITIQPDLIKIDRSIIGGCDQDMSRRMIINSLVKLAKTKRIMVLAEGVETEGELRTVISCGVDLLQGYYFNRPLFEPEPIAPEISDRIRQLAQASGVILS